MVHALFQEHSRAWSLSVDDLSDEVHPKTPQILGKESLSRNGTSLPKGAWLWFLLGVALPSDLLPAREKHGMWAVHFYPEQHHQLDGKSLQFSECL